MEGIVTLAGPAALDIYDRDHVYHGGNQDWYAEHWQQQAGCGPTNCANLLWYLAKTRDKGRPLWRGDATGKADFLKLMERVWRFVTPGAMGVNSTRILTEGAERYGREHGAPLIAEALQVAPKHLQSRHFARVYDFIGHALERDRPVAFLNLSNGTLENLDSWHWVTLVALRGEKALAYDQGEARWLNLNQWVATSVMGGGFVALEVE